MHVADGRIPADYLGYVRIKYLWIVFGIILLFFLFIISISVGAVSIPPYDVLMTLFGQNVNHKYDAIIWNIRLPQALTAIIAGIGLSVAGLRCSHSRNPWDRHSHWEYPMQVHLELQYR